MSEFDKKISALTSGTDSTATDEYVIARGGSNFKISGALVAAAATKVGTLASLAVTGNVSLGADVVLSRGAADRLDLASGDSLNIVSGTVKIAGTDVLGATTLGSGVTASSLTSVGTLSSLTVTGDLTVDTSTLKVNAANNHVGIGTATPAALLDLNAGSGANTNIAISQANSVKWFIGNVDTTNAFRFFDNTALVERMRIDASGNVGIGVTPSARNNTRLQIVDGIGFPATQVASSDANTLDDYEEGNWSPTIIGTTTGGTGTYDKQQGFYTKIGRVVTVQGHIKWTAHTGTGNMTLGNFPFPTSATADRGYSAGTIGYFTGLTLAADHYATLLAEHVSSSFALIVENPVGGGTSQTAPIDTNAGFYFQLTYTTS